VSERETVSFDGPPACPFLALVDDRDARFDRPDRSHRCYAESPPAPRATAHQIAFCLGSAFSACPTFADWARREVARVKAPDPWRSGDDDERIAPRPEARAAPGAAPVAGGAAAGRQYDRRRDWAAPPPWSADAVNAPGTGSGGPDAGTGARPAVDRGASAGSGPGTSGAAADADRDAGQKDAGGAAVAGAGAAAAAAPAFLAGRSRGAPDVTPGPASSPASSSPPPSRTAQGAASPGWDEHGSGAGERRPAPGAAGSRPRPSSRQRSVDRGAPAWEEPRHYEAYPTIKTRARLPGLSPLLLGVAAIAIAAVALFFLPPMFLGLGGSSSPTPVPSPSVEATPIPTATPVPEPTPETYVVKSGDSLSKIASSYGLSVDELLAANPQIKDPNKIQVGDEIVIPQPVPSEIVDPGLEEASPAP
jgi:LysM repeat protein